MAHSAFIRVSTWPDAMVPLDVTAAQFARDIQVPPKRMTAILHGSRAVTADTALLWVGILGRAPNFG
jgi:plasmid maintenance system antidote protein VapI